MKKSTTKRALLMSVLSMFLCFTMLIGTTFAWFTDEVESGVNTIVAGNLDVELYNGLDDTAAQVEDTTVLFDGIKLWEPGAVVYENLTVANKGTLALKYALSVQIAKVQGSVNLADVLKVAVVEGITTTDRAEVLNMASGKWQDFESFVETGKLYPDGYVDPNGATGPFDQTKTYGIVIWWEPSDKDNDYNMKEGAEQLKLTIGVNLFATQLEGEMDSFGPDYDADATYPVNISASTSVVTDANNKTTAEAIITYSATSTAISEVKVAVPAGAQLKDGATQLTLKIEEAEGVNPDVATQITSSQTATTYEISLEGLADTNDQDVEVKLVIEKGLVDVKLYHKGTLIPCTYDAFTGELTFKTKGFSPFTVVSATKVFEEGKGTAEDPYIIKTPEDMLNISKYYHEYKYYKVADGVETLDLNGIGNLSLYGSFDGNGVKIVNLNTALFKQVGHNNDKAEIKISNMDVTVYTTDGRALVRNIFNAGNTIFENVAMHGYIEGQYNMGSFYNYGTANYGGSDGSDYTVTFVNATSDVTLVCTTGNVMGGMLGHGYEGANYKLYVNMDEKSGYTGKMYTTNGATCYQVMALCSHATYVLNGVETSRTANTYSSTKLTVVAPTAGADGYYVAPVEGVASYVVALNAQITAYDKNGNKIANLSGMTGNLGSTTVTEGFDKAIFDLISSVKIVNGLDHDYSYVMNDGALTVYTGKSSNYASGWITLQVNQYDADGNLLATGITTVYDIKEVSTADQLIAALKKGGDVVLAADIELAENTTVVIGNGVKVNLNLNGHTISSKNTRTATHNFLIDVKGGELTVKNGTVSYEHTGANMGWNGATTVIDVTAGGVLNLENAVIENKGGTDMNFAVHLNNWGSVTLNADNCVFDAPYCSVRVFNSGPDMNNVTIENSKMTGATRAFWVHNYASSDMGGKTYSGSSVAYDKAVVDARMNFDVFGNGNTFEITGTAKSPIRYGFNETIYFDADGNIVE